MRLAYKSIIIFSLTCIILLSDGCGRASINYASPRYPGWNDVATGKLTVKVISAGKADAIVITTAHHAIVIDTGLTNDGDKVIKYLQSMNDTTIDDLILTHFDIDHVGGAAKIIKSCTVKQVYQPDYAENNKEYKKYIAASTTTNVSIKKLTKETGDAWFVLDDALINIYPPQKDSYTDVNSYSLVTTIWHGKEKFLFCADADGPRLSELMSRGSLHADFLKVPHHGDPDPKDQKFIGKVHPTYAAVCDSKESPCSKEVKGYLKDDGVKVFYTRNGSITCISDGKTLNITQDPAADN